MLKTDIEEREYRFDFKRFHAPKFASIWTIVGTYYQEKIFYVYKSYHFF